MKVVSGIALAALAAIVAAFAVANRTPVRLSLEPLAYEVTTPVFALVIAALFVGALIGLGAAWLGGAKRRRRSAALRRRLAVLERQREQAGVATRRQAHPANDGANDGGAARAQILGPGAR